MLGFGGRIGDRIFDQPFSSRQLKKCGQIANAKTQLAHSAADAHHYHSQARRSAP